MNKFRANQTVYFYYSTDEFMGEIVQAHIVSICKDLTTKEITYNIKKDSMSRFDTLPSWMNDYTFTLKGENLYSSYKKIAEDYKDEIVYNNLRKQINELEKAIDNIVKDYAEKINADSLNGKYLTISDSNLQPLSIKIDGVGDLKEELTKLKKEIDGIKKKIKKPTKQPVIKQSKDNEKENNKERK